MQLFATVFCRRRSISFRSLSCRSLWPEKSVKCSIRQRRAWWFCWHRGQQTTRLHSSPDGDRIKSSLSLGHRLGFPRETRDPRGQLAFGADAFFDRIALQNVEGQTTHGREITRSIALLYFAGVLSKADIQLPMFVVFNPPVVARRVCQLAGSHPSTGNEVADFLCRFAVARAFTPTHAYRCEASPEFAVPNILQIRDRVIRAAFLSCRSRGESSKMKECSVLCVLRSIYCAIGRHAEEFWQCGESFPNIEIILPQLFSLDKRRRMFPNDHLYAHQRFGEGSTTA